MNSEFDSLVINNNWSRIEIYELIHFINGECIIIIENDENSHLFDVYEKFRREHSKYEPMTRTFDEFVRNITYLVSY